MENTEIADNPEVQSEVSGEVTTLTAEDWIKAREGGEKEEQPEEPESQAEETEEESEGNEEESEETDAVEDGDVLSQIDFDSLTQEQKIAIAEKVGSGAGKEIGKLRRELREAKGQLEELSDAPKVVRRPTDNPYGHIESEADLQKAAAAIEANMEWAEEQLLDAGQYSADDVMFENGGKKYTKRDIHRILKDARKALTNHLPEQRDYLRRLGEIPRQREQLMERAKSELEYLSDSENELTKKFNSMLKDKRFAVLEKVAPELHAQLPYIFAHAVPSLFEEKKGKSLRLPIKSKPKPIQTPSGGGASPGNPRESKSKEIDKVKRRFVTGEGTQDDFIKLRAAMRQNK